MLLGGGRFRAFRLLLCVGAMLGLLSCSGGSGDSSQSGALYEVYLEHSLLTMRDGVELGVTYYRPKSQKPSEVFPVVFEMVPYRKDDFFALGDYEYGTYFAKHGYVLARVDARGTGASSGAVPVSEYSQAEIADAVELVDQFSKMPWSNGKVGMYGISWSAFNSLMTAKRKPPALKAIIAAHGSTDLFYNDVHYIDGALHIDSYAHQIDTDNSMPRSPDYRIDDAYFKDRFDQEPWIFTWLRQQQDGPFWRQESLRFKEPLEVPAYLIGGLLDGYRDFVMDVMQTSKAPVIAEVGPWNHAWPEYGQPGPNYEWRQKALRWWDYWLKDKDNGILDEPRWMAFMREGHKPDANLTKVPGYWRCEKQWPLQGSSSLQFYPQAAKQLAKQMGNALDASPQADTLPYHAGAGVVTGNWWGEQTGNMTADDQYSLFYDSEPMTEAVEIMGMPEVQLRVSADAPFYQWSVRLEDVAPDGSVSLVSGALINPSQRVSRLNPQPLIAGEEVVLSTSIHLTTWRFKPGHRVRLAVTNAQFPMAWPSPTPGSTKLHRGQDTWLKLPVVPLLNASAHECSVPAPEPSDQADFGKWLVEGNPVSKGEYNPTTGDSTFTTTSDSAWTLNGNLYKSSESYRWHVNDKNPAQAQFEGQRRNLFTISGREIDLSTRSEINSDTTHFHISFTKRLLQNGVVVKEKTWTDSIARHFQ